MQKIFGLVAILMLGAGCYTGGVVHLNEAAAVHAADALPENPLLLIPFSSAIQPVEKRMSTLYGNEKAAVHARETGETDYPAGAVLYEVTWAQKPDSLWYGANVPDKIVSVERIAIGQDGRPLYTLYRGQPLKMVADQPASRISFILSQRMAVSP